MIKNGPAMTIACDLVDRGHLVVNGDNYKRLLAIDKVIGIAQRMLTSNGVKDTLALVDELHEPLWVIDGGQGDDGR